MHRLGIFSKNLLKAAEHQLADPTAVHGVTQFSDLSELEFQRFYTGMRTIEPELAVNEARVVGDEEVENLPDNFDWRDKGAVTDVKMQVWFILFKF